MGRIWSITLPRAKRPGVVTARSIHKGTEMERKGFDEPAQAYLSMAARVLVKNKNELAANILLSVTAG